MPLNELLREWRKIYLEMLARGISVEEALDDIAHLMLAKEEDG